MEKIISFDEWFKTAVAPPEEYYFTFDENGNITGLHPGHAQFDRRMSVKIDNNLAYLIYEGTENLSSFKIDVFTMEILKVSRLEFSGLVRMDDVLHRVIDKRWSKITKPDVSVEYNRSESLLTLSINPVLKAVEWQGEQEMVFLVTGYNDPNLLKNMFNFKVNEIVSYPQRFNIELEDRFSIYTRRLFDKYTFEEL